MKMIITVRPDDLFATVFTPNGYSFSLKWRNWWWMEQAINALNPLTLQIRAEE